MKNYILPLIALAFAFTGCDELKEKSFDASYAKNLTVDVDENSGDGAFDISEVLNALSNENLEQVQDKIKSYDIREMSYKIWEYDGPVTSEMQGEIKILNGNGDVLFSSAIAPELLVDMNADEAYRLIEMTDEEEKVITDALLNDNSVTVRATGTVSEVPVHFVLQMRVDVTAVAEVED